MKKREKRKDTDGNIRHDFEGKRKKKKKEND